MDLARTAQPAARMTPRVYVEGPLRAGMTVDLPDSARHHARVLRLHEGDGLTLFDGSGGEWSASFVSKTKVELQAWRDAERESPLTITLVQGVSSGERMDYTVQKAVELGVAAIQPLLTKKGVVRLEGNRASARVSHWQRIVIAACEQCGRNRLPQVLPLLAFHEYRPEGDGPRLLLSAQGRSIREFEVKRDALLAAGPEAGFAAEEQAALGRAGFAKASLGPRILRTETAALAALAALSALRGDF
jgi:16S rRNA (uracil1498-N3)-methyltransferase